MSDVKERLRFGIIIAFVLMLILFSLFPQSSEDNKKYDLLYDNDIPDENGILDPASFGLHDGYLPYHPNPAPFSVTQPDGTEFKARMVGDVLGGHAETLLGYSIVQDDEGWWTYAQWDEYRVLIPSHYRVGKVDPETISGLSLHMKNDPPVEFDSSNYYAKRGTRAPPTIGTAQALAIMLNFTDEDFDSGNNKAHFQQMLNSTTANSMRKYYREVSYGMFDIEVDVFGPYPSVHTMAYYGADGSGRDNANGPIFEMAREAVQLADADGVNFTKYDTDLDGEIDALFIIHAGSGQEDSPGITDEIWSHQSVIMPGELTDDGIYATVYSTEPEDGKIGVFCHEFGHVLDLPDLYDADYGGSGGQSNGIGDWGVMGGGSWNGGGNTPSHFSAWSKIQLGWVDPIIVTSDISLSTIQIKPVKDFPEVYKIWAHDPSVNISEYFLVENRQKKGYDSALPGDGVLVWHIDDTVGSIAWNSVNVNPSHLRVDLEEAHGGTQHLTANSNQGDANDPWKGQAKNFTTSSDPNSNSYNGSASEVWVWNFSTILADGNMTLGFNEIYSGPTGLYLVEPFNDTLILPVQDFIINDSDFPDEDVDTGSGSYILQHSPAALNLWGTTPSQTPKGWTPGVGWIINCSGLPNGTWDFRVKFTDEEGHVFFTQPVINVMILDLAPPVAEAGPDNTTGTDYPVVLDASASSDDSGFIAWYNWTFGDGEFLNGYGPWNATITHIYTVPGNYTVTLNVSDAQGNWDVDSLNVSVYDASPPVTNLTMSGPRFRVNGSHDWNITESTMFNLSAYDIFTTVNHTWYIIDGVYFEFQGIPFDLSGYNEGEHTIIYGSEDGIGNNDTGKVITVWIDESEPLTSISIGSPKHPALMVDGCNITSPTLITLTAGDKPDAHNSGVNFTWYMIEGDYYVGTIFDLFGYGEGAVNITWGSIDNLDHNESGNSIVIWVDDSDPTTGISTAGPQYPAGPPSDSNVTTITTFILDPQDNPIHSSGINFTWYKIDDDYYVGTSFNLSGYDEGLHNITWGSEDNLFHNETGNLIRVWVDETYPFSHLIPGGPKYPGFPYEGTNVTSETVINLTGWDEPVNHSAGIDFFWYDIDGDLYVGDSFNLSGYGEGSHLIIYGSQDYLGNNGTKSIVLWVDDSPPVTNLTIGSQKYPASGFNGCNVTSSTSFTFTSVDLPSHNASVMLTWYTVDGKYYEGTNFTLSIFGLGEGSHNITWGSIDNIYQNETINEIVVYLDKMPPETNIEVGEPNSREYQYQLYNVTTKTLFTLNSSDSISGVAFSWYYIDGEYFEGSSFNLSGYEDGEHSITYGSMDNLGFNESESTISVILDMTPPNSSLEIIEPKTRQDPQDLWNVTSSTLFRIISEDDFSGFKQAWYMIDGEYYNGSLFWLNGIPDGLHNITWGSIDELGNNGTSNFTLVILDNTHPDTDIEVKDPKYRGDTAHTWNVTWDAEFELDTWDQYSGVNITWYTIDGVYFEGSIFNLTNQTEGFHELTWGTVDIIGNNETGNYLAVYVDILPPTSQIQLGPHRFRKENSDLWNVTNQTTFTLSSSDPYCGVAKIWHTVDGNYYEGTGFDLSGLSDGVHTITWGALDNLDHNETSNVIHVVLDNSPPETSQSMEGPQKRQEDSHVWNITQTTSFTLTSLDDLCGVSFIWYTIDDEYHIGSEFTLNGFVDGLHTISWGAQDNLDNNESVSTLTVNVDTTPPQTTIFIGNETPPSGERVNMNTSTLVVLEAEDGSGSDVDFIWYSLDSGTIYMIYEGPFTLDLNVTTIIFGAQDKLENNATKESVRVDVDEPPPVIIDDEPDPNGNGDDDVVEPEPASQEILQMLMDYLLYLIIVIIVIVLLVVLLRRRKGKEDQVDFQAQQTQQVYQPPQVQFEAPAATYQSEEHVDFSVLEQPQPETFELKEEPAEDVQFIEKEEPPVPSTPAPPPPPAPEAAPPAKAPSPSPAAPPVPPISSKTLKPPSKAPPPAPSAPIPSKTSSTPAQEKSITKKIRCPKCKERFEVKLKKGVNKMSCPHCGTAGKITL